MAMISKRSSMMPDVLADDSLDTRRISTLKPTSLSVLNIKKAHKTHIQRQFHEYNKQQQHHQRQQRRVSEFNQLQHQQNLYSIQSVPSPYYNSNASQVPLSPEQQSFYNGLDLSPPNTTYNNKANRSRTSINSQSQPSTTIHSDHTSSSWSSTPGLKPAPTFNQTISPIYSSSSSSEDYPMGDTIKELQDMNFVLNEENELLRDELKKSRNFASVNDNQMNRLLQQRDDELKQSFSANERLELQIEALNQELSKLKLVTKTNMDLKDRELKKLKLENSELQSELETQYHNSSLTSEDISTSTSIPSEEIVTKDIKPLPQNNDELIPLRFSNKQPNSISNSNSSKYTDDLITDLLITIKYLKSDNQSLELNNSIISENLKRQKKLTKRLVENSNIHNTSTNTKNKNGNAKIKKGLRLIQTVDVLI